MQKITDGVKNHLNEKREVPNWQMLAIGVIGMVSAIAGQQLHRNSDALFGAESGVSVNIADQKAHDQNLKDHLFLGQQAFYMGVTDAADKQSNRAPGEWDGLYRADIEPAHVAYYDAGYSYQMDVGFADEDITQALEFNNRFWTDVDLRITKAQHRSTGLSYMDEGDFHGTMGFINAVSFFGDFSIFDDPNTNSMVKEYSLVNSMIQKQTYEAGLEWFTKAGGDQPVIAEIMPEAFAKYAEQQTGGAWQFQKALSADLVVDRDRVEDNTPAYH